MNSTKRKDTQPNQSDEISETSLTNEPTTVGLSTPSRNNDNSKKKQLKIRHQW